MRFDSAERWRRWSSFPSNARSTSRADRGPRLSFCAALSAGWRVEQHEASCRGLRALLNRWQGIGCRWEWLANRTARPLRSKSLLIVARTAVPSQLACRVIFLSHLEPLPSMRMAWRVPRPGNGSGPALLLEMARAWPKAWTDRFEPMLVVAVGMCSGFAVVREMVRLIREQWNETPTLMVVMLAPGMGRELTIWGRPRSLRLMVREAARSLWIPVKTGMTPTGMLLGHRWQVSSRLCDQIVLMGAEYKNARPPPVDPAALTRTAQLASEIALRWVNQQKEQAL